MNTKSDMASLAVDTIDNITNQIRLLQKLLCQAGIDPDKQLSSVILTLDVVRSEAMMTMTYNMPSAPATSKGMSVWDFEDEEQGQNNE